MNIAKLMKQAQAMQANMVQAQEELAQRFYTAEGAGGKIKVTSNGAGDITDICIDPSVIDPEDVEFLQSLLLKTVQEAISGAKSMAEKEMKKLTGGMGLPF